MHISVTNAFQKVLSKIEPPTIEGSFSSQFALRRFVKKFEVPDRKTNKTRKLKTFEAWRDFDQKLKRVHLPHGSWYRAREKLHKSISDFRYGELMFTGGSQSEPLFGRQSIPEKLLTHKWECSPDCADIFVKLALHDVSFIRAAKIRLRKSLGDEGYRTVVRRIFSIRRKADDVRKYILYSQLVCRDASRYSTVRKNNEIDRSIDLQPFINMLVQRAIGLGLREVLKRHFNVDLEHLQPIHGHMIKDKRFATVDLRNASDSNTWSLVSFLYPSWFVQVLRSACPTFTEGLDKQYYCTSKVSSMGNGFTFELMTLTLLALVRHFDPLGSVFGDDIIIRNEFADELIVALSSAGWDVNVEKTFINSPFRESCGANYHDDYGYIKSFDFRFPENIGDCMSFWNKCLILREIPYFEGLVKLLYRTIPPALRGPFPPIHMVEKVVGRTDEIEDLLCSTFFNEKCLPDDDPRFQSYAQALNFPKWFFHFGYVYKPCITFVRKNHISMKRQPHLYFAYMHGGRKSDIVRTNVGDWVKVGYLSNGRYSIRVKDLKYLNDNL